MAETKSRAPSGRRKTTTRKPATTKRKATKARKVSAAEASAKQTGQAVSQAVSEAGHNAGRLAQKAKTPLLAGGAAVAGAAGGLALGAHQTRKSKALRRPRLKIRSRDLARAARDVGQFGMDVGELATELRRNRESANGSKHRSPVEVVLDGLTHRGNSS